MHTQEKQAWFILSVMAATAVLYLAIAVPTGFNPAAFGAFGLMGLAGGAPMIGRRERKAGKVVMDERDHEIARRASLASFSIFWLLLVAGVMVPFFVLGPSAQVTIQVYVLCALLMPAAGLVYLVQSIAVIVMYRRGERA
jgi:hypothetical protein